MLVLVMVTPGERLVTLSISGGSGPHITSGPHDCAKIGSPKPVGGSGVSGASTIVVIVGPLGMNPGLTATREISFDPHSYHMLTYEAAFLPAP